jgi:hypothetical protein
LAYNISNGHPVSWFCIVRVVLVGLMGCRGTAKSVWEDSGAGTDSGARSAPVMTIPPIAQVLGPDSVRIRFEIRGKSDEFPILLTGSDGSEAVHVPDRFVQQVEFYFPDEDNAAGLEHPDLAGSHTVHELVLEELTAGETIGWSLELGVADVMEGSFRVPPAAGEPFTAVLTGDTMEPMTDAMVLQAQSFDGEVLLHGGDIQYQFTVTDSWSETFWSLSPLLSEAVFHPAVGNHEDESRDEYNEMYSRIFGGQGEGGTGADYHSFTYGGIRFLAVNTEQDLADPRSTQVQWIIEELAAVMADPDLHAAIPYFHRPIYTLANHAPEVDFREVLHPIFVEYGVPLVFQSHNHCYERFEVDGVVYLVEGGGGALLYDTDDQVDSRPDELPLRMAAVRSWGHTQMTFAAGSVELTRIDIDGKIDDTTTVTWSVPDADTAR